MTGMTKDDWDENRSLRSLGMTGITRDDWGG